jgi:hypothetical protein
MDPRGEAPGPYLEFPLQPHDAPLLTHRDFVKIALRRWDDERRLDTWLPSTRSSATPLSGANLIAAIEAELLPIVVVRGRRLICEPSQADGLDTVYGLVREKDGLTQVLAIHVPPGAPLLLAVRFLVVDERFSAKRRILTGGGQRPKRVRFPKKLFRGLTEEDGPIAYLIEIARREIRAIETFLASGERNACVYLGPGAAKRTWPKLPGAFRLPPEWDD